MINLIVAMDEQRGIGHQGALPWHIQEDLNLFKQLTLNSTVVMGRSTFSSIGKALPHRLNYVATRSRTLFEETAYLKRLDNYTDFLEHHRLSEDQIFIIGGSNMYQTALPYVRNFYVSHIKGSFECDTFFPDFEFAQLVCVSTKDYDLFTFCHYQQEQPCATS